MQAATLLRTRPQAFCTCGAARLHTLPVPRTVRAQAENNPFDGPSKSSSPSSAANSKPAVSDEERERALELLERRSRGQVAKARKAIPIRNQAQEQKPDTSTMAPWKEGELFPEGWENMNIGQKMAELYLGRRGILFWANKAAYASVFIVIGGWILFRLVGPNLGLYKLAGDAMPPPL